MARKPTTRRRASRYTDEQVAEYRRRDAEIMDSSTARLEDGDTVRRFAHQMATGGVSDRVLSYSVRNQILLHTQAEERGFRLTDVDTAKGWRTRGRHIKKGETGLRLVRPVTKQPKDADPAAGQAEPQRDAEERDEADDEGDGDEKTRKPKFRTGVVFDLSQTAEIPPENSDACAECEAEAGQPCNPGCTCLACIGPELLDAEDAAETLWNNYVEQVEKAGYALDWPAPAATLAGQRVRVDHDARTVHAAMNATAADPAAVAELAAVLAAIVAREDRAAEQRRAERKAARLALTAAPASN
ncbi:ArdC family protein [Actinoplanes sp. NPDC051851]|uniref:ArdC family protein n=1 Tax=Actinoplanes sp. NPDC051851 TaxID=3154753 RepID=UPI0034290A8C